MTVREIQNILSAEVVCGGDCLDREVRKRYDERRSCVCQAAGSSAHRAC